VTKAPVRVILTAPPASDNGAGADGAQDGRAQQPSV
jgi:hypothetical protein